MDPSLGPDSQHKLEQLSDHPDFDVHLRVQEHRVEGYLWSHGRRYRIVGIRDEEARAETPDSSC
jgi:hypothetical protein